jgi:hypothetical protein
MTFPRIVRNVAIRNGSNKNPVTSEKIFTHPYGRTRENKVMICSPDNNEYRVAK